MCSRSATTVGRIGLSDVEAFRELRLRALRDDPKAFGSTHENETQRSLAEWRARVEDSTAGDSAFLALATVDGVAVGMVGGYEPADRPADREVVSMWVGPAWRGTGLGRSLIEAVEAWAAAAGAVHLTLWVVASNTPAVNLYHRAGFAETGETRPLPSDQSLIQIQMSKSIAPG